MYVFEGLVCVRVRVCVYVCDEGIRGLILLHKQASSHTS